MVIQLCFPIFNKIAITDKQVALYSGIYISDKVSFKLYFKANGNILLGGNEENDLKKLTPTAQHQFMLDELVVTINFQPQDRILKFKKDNGDLIIFEISKYILVVNNLTETLIQKQI